MVQPMVGWIRWTGDFGGGLEDKAAEGQSRMREFELRRVDDGLL